MRRGYLIAAVVLTIALAMVIAGCPKPPEPEQGPPPNEMMMQQGQPTEPAVEGEAVEGEAVEGEAPAEGEAVEGEAVEGEADIPAKADGD